MVPRIRLLTELGTLETPITRRSHFYPATCYKNGKGTEKNLEKAFLWYQKAAENGNEDAMNNLAT
ncbi:hypothetical protein RhiirA1_484349 [Rhizophagus irregularis]|uniref:Uncharacterized protein n=1 Tax=Rhizophagus irregularis TaxID=588596 RepID=A0A2N0QJE9_9GLOM|nr:hypothetical protein RhiirA1_484349 [Rhizophagus irregularis]